MITVIPRKVPGSCRRHSGGRWRGKGNDMGDEQACTEYGSWAQYNNGLSVSPRDEVIAFLGEDFVKDYDVDGLTEAYVEAVAGTLPDGVTLAGSTFYGPYPMPEDMGEHIREAIASVGITDAILARFERKGSE